MLKGQLLPAPLHPKGTSACSLSLEPHPPHQLRVDRLLGEVHERLPPSGSLEGCTSGCAKLASLLFTPLQRQPWRWKLQPCLQAARFLPPPAGKGSAARPSKPFFWGPSGNRKGSG